MFGIMDNKMNIAIMGYMGFRVGGGGGCVLVWDLLGNSFENLPRRQAVKLLVVFSNIPWEFSHPRPWINPPPSNGYHKVLL